MARLQFLTAAGDSDVPTHPARDVLIVPFDESGTGPICRPVRIQLQVSAVEGQMVRDGREPPHDPHRGGELGARSAPVKALDPVGVDGAHGPAFGLQKIEVGEGLSEGKAELVDV